MSKLSSDQLETILRAARPLARGDHDAFIADVTEALANCAELGEGVVHRVVRDVQRRYWSPPALGSHWSDAALAVIRHGVVLVRVPVSFTARAHGAALPWPGRVQRLVTQDQRAGHRPRAQATCLAAALSGIPFHRDRVAVACGSDRAWCYPACERRRPPGARAHPGDRGVEDAGNKWRDRAS